MRRLWLAAALAACGHTPKTTPPEPEVPAAPDAGVAAEELRTAAIEQAMTTLDPVAHQCWAAAATDDYQLAGDVSLLVTVDGKGQSTVEVHADTARDEVLTRCLVAVVGAYPWPAPMHGASALIPFSFSAPAGQNLIDRALVPDVEAGARVLLDARNSGNGAVSLFELVVPAGELSSPTASQRAEVWIALAPPYDATYLPPGAVRAPEGPARILVIAVPGGTEDATRESGVLPASPAKARDKKAPKPVAAGADGAFVGQIPKVGTVSILVEPDRVKNAKMAVSILDIDAGAVIPEHVHDGSTEVIYMLDGAGTMTIDGVVLPVTATSVIQIPAGVPHAFTASEDAAAAIQIYTPAGPEQRFKKK